MANQLFSNYPRARNQKIIEPYYARNGTPFDKWITYKSPNLQRRGAIQLSLYLHLEVGLTFDLVEYRESWLKHKTEVLSITDLIVDKDNNEWPALIGYLAFLTFRENPVLYQCYIHPSYRRQGLMTKAWEEAKIRYPQFEVDQPSPAMVQFMSTVDCSHVLKST